VPAPAGVLVLILLGLLIYDFVRGPQGIEGTDDGRRKGPGLQYEVADRDPVLNFIESRDNYRFGLVLPREKDPLNPDEHKRLTYRENGSTNNTCVQIDGQPSLFGKPRGQRASAPRLDKENLFWSTSWMYPEKVLVTQQIQIVPGAQSGKLDTCLVHYIVKNTDRITHTVGLRVMFDTYIGSNDGVPFMLSNRKGLINTPLLLEEKDVPDYLQALERSDPSNPGTVAYMGLKGLEIPKITLEPIHRMILRKFPGSETRWDADIPGDEMGKPIDDSCVLLFWDYRVMTPDETRHMAFSYGLNAFSSPEGSSNLLLTAGGSFTPGNEFTVTAYITKPAEGDKVKLEDLPEGLHLVDGQQQEQVIDAKSDYTQVSWRIHSDKAGAYDVRAASSRGARALLKVRITSSLFR
jgi:hypothetical protein